MSLYSDARASHHKPKRGPFRPPPVPPPATIGWRYQQEESQASKARQGKEGGGKGTREKGGGGGESAAPSSQNLRRRPLVENRIPIAPSGEKRYSCLKALRSNCLASPLCETLCVKLDAA